MYNFPLSKAPGKNNVRMWGYTPTNSHSLGFMYSSECPNIQHLHWPQPCDTNPVNTIAHKVNNSKTRNATATLNLSDTLSTKSQKIFPRNKFYVKIPPKATFNEGSTILQTFQILLEGKYPNICNSKALVRGYAIKSSTIREWFGLTNSLPLKSSNL